MKAGRGIVGGTYYQRDYDPAGQRPDGWVQPQSTKHEPVVYYMRLDRLVKIGWTTDLKRRVSSIAPQGVMAIEPGGKNIEERRHIEFAALRSHREWFWLRDPIAAHIVTIRAQLEEREGITTEHWLEQHNVYPQPIHNPGVADA